jgi:hypothetical protein
VRRVFLVRWFVKSRAQKPRHKPGAVAAGSEPYILSIYTFPLDMWSYVMYTCDIRYPQREFTHEAMGNWPLGSRLESSALWRYSQNPHLGAPYG